MKDEKNAKSINRLSANNMKSESHHPIDNDPQTGWAEGPRTLGRRDFLKLLNTGAAALALADAGLSSLPVMAETMEKEEPNSIGPDWKPSDKGWARSLGTHRVVVRVGEPAPAARARLEWRRRDLNPEKKAVLVYDLKTGKKVANVLVEMVSSVYGQVLFEPASGAGEYAIYFLPVKIEGGSFPVSHYLEPAAPAADWAAVAAKSDAQVLGAEPVRWEALTEHDAWNAMEVIATPEETATAAQRAFKGMRVFVSGSKEAVRMEDRLPARWATQTNAGEEDMTAQRGEYAVFQVAVWATEAELRDVRVVFPSHQRGKTALNGFVCLSTDGVDWKGNSFTRQVNVPRGRVQAFWCGVPIPDNIPSSVTRLTAELAVKAEGHPTRKRQIAFRLKAGIAPDHGDADPNSYSRLRWLNSTTGLDDQPTKGYTALAVNGNTIRCLGREVELNDAGLPARVSTFFNLANTRIESAPQRQLLTSPVSFTCEFSDGRPAALKPSAFHFTRQSAGAVEWTSRWSGPHLEANVTGRMEFDGSLRFRIALAATDRVVSLRDVRLNFPRTVETTLYALGLQLEAGLCPGHWDWKWDVAHKNQDSVWLGAVNGGLRVQLKGESYVMPAINIHYQRRPLNDPPSWSGGGVGGMEFQRETDSARLTCRSGARTLEAGKPLHFDFDLLVTPFHTLHTSEQWRDRYYHSGIPEDVDRYLDQVKAGGANIVNVHQGNQLNPYINYPFITWARLRDFARAAHDRGLRAKYYYTVRELSDWCVELFALRSMGDDVLLSGKGGGHPWGEEHLGGNYWQAWYEPAVEDVSFLTQTMGRWDNYYVEGLRWLCENAGCDGLYLDDIAYTRDIMLRVRQVLDRHCPRGGLIDLHSWNEFQTDAAWAHCANLFMDSLPFVDRLWFGEGHEYSGPPPEHFLVEISGVPFGLMGEMLQGGGNPWLGLVHGCTGRLAYLGMDPRPIWKLWDDFGVQESEFIGWWAGADCPVRCADPLVKISVWRKKTETLVGIGNFTATEKTVALIIDGNLGLDLAAAKLHAPAIPDLEQDEGAQAATQPVTLKPYGGAAFILR